MKPNGKNSRGAKIPTGKVKSPAQVSGNRTITPPVAPQVYRRQPKTSAQAKMSHSPQSKSVQATTAGPAQMKTRSGVAPKQPRSFKTPPGIIQRSKAQSLADMIKEMQKISKGGGGGGGGKNEEEDLCNSCLVNPAERT